MIFTVHIGLAQASLVLLLLALLQQQRSSQTCSPARASLAQALQDPHECTLSLPALELRSHKSVRKLNSSCCAWLPQWPRVEGLGSAGKGIPACLGCPTAGCSLPGNHATCAQTAVSVLRCRFLSSGPSGSDALSFCFCIFQISTALAYNSEAP